MRRFGVVGLLAVGCVTAVFGVPSAVAFQGPWVTPAVDLSAAGEQAYNPNVAVGPDGTATAVWERNSGTKRIVQASTRPPRGGFGGPVDVSAVDQVALDPQVAVAPDGTTTAVWQSSNGPVSIVQASTRPPGGTFGSPVDLSAAGKFAHLPQLAVAQDGTTTVIWQLSGVSDRIVQARTRPPGGTFGSVVDLSATGELSDSPDVAVASDGTTTAVWRRDDGTDKVVQASTRPPGGAFGSPVDLSAAGGNVDDEPRVAVASDGTTTVVWTDTSAQTTTRPPGGTFGSVVDLSAAGQSALDAQVAVAPDGTTAATWYRSDGTDDRVQLTTRPPGGAFGSPVDLSAAGGSADDPQVAVAPDGTSTVIWKRSDGTDPIVQTSTLPPGGAFGSPVDLSAAGGSADDPQVAVAPDGTSIAIWRRSDPTNYIVQAAFTVGPPLPTPPAPPAPAQPVAPRPRPISAATAFALPSAKRCVSRRSFKIRIRKIKGVTFVRATVLVNGKRVKTLTGKRLSAPVNLKGLPKGRFTVKITANAKDGRTVSGTRRYRTCTPKRKTRKKSTKL